MYQQTLAYLHLISTHPLKVRPVGTLTRGQGLSAVSAATFEAQNAVQKGA
jgi:hypothetical protein